MKPPVSIGSPAPDSGSQRPPAVEPALTRPMRIIVVLAVLAALIYGVLFRPPPGSRSLRDFEADRMADLELGMWQAYYRKENIQLFRLLVMMLHEQYHYTWARATEAGFYLARAAATFGNLRSDYERVLPDLERAYALAKDWTAAGFDPAAVARAELAWWVARRIPAEGSAEHVGALIADEYALLYEVPRPRVVRAAMLRAEAAALRDAGADQADWPAVSRLLRESYGELHAALSAP